MTDMSSDGCLGVHEVLQRTRVLPVVVMDDAAVATGLGEALLEAELPVAEVTFRTAAAEAAIRTMAAIDGLVVGAGTVLTADQVDRAAEAGARFVVSPGFSQAVVTRCRELGVAVFPGVATATEMMSAIAAGVEVVKFFPAEAAGGTRALRALGAPFPGLRFIPTGGISATNAPSYLSMPAVMAVGGSWMVDRELLHNKDFATVTRLACEALSLGRLASSL
jgi:2-dehydro-3-deoxyphosphogluconate aldolase/(4S)-4-hydroxy-2-oxoglutarate aldolase